MRCARLGTHGRTPRWHALATRWCAPRAAGGGGGQAGQPPTPRVERAWARVPWCMGSTAICGLQRVALVIERLTVCATIPRTCGASFGRWAGPPAAQRGPASGTRRRSPLGEAGLARIAKTRVGAAPGSCSWMRAGSASPAVRRTWAPRGRTPAAAPPAPLGAAVDGGDVLLSADGGRAGWRSTSSGQLQRPAADRRPRQPRFLHGQKVTRCGMGASHRSRPCRPSGQPEWLAGGERLPACPRAQVRGMGNSKAGVATTCDTSRPKSKQEEASHSENGRC